MSTKENLHQGHRQRLLNKLFANPHLLADHEILEGLLFYAIPRVDTNPLAHKLLKVFGSLDKVLSAGKTELLAVDGIGKKTAEFLVLIGNVFARAQQCKTDKTEYSSPEKVNNALRQDFQGLANETCIILLLDKNYRKLCQLVYSDKNSNKVSIDLNELVNMLAGFRPSFAIMAHNHVGVPAYPSKEDDIATKKVHLLCSVHGVNLIEHLIFQGEQDKYSYNGDGRLEMIKQQTQIENILELGGAISNE